MPPQFRIDALGRQLSRLGPLRRVAAVAVASQRVVPFQRAATTLGAKSTPLPDFNSTPYASKSMSELLRARLVFTVSQMKPVVARADSLVHLSYRFLGHGITNYVLRSSFFGHFCAGEDEKSIAPTVKYLESNGIGSILDYAAEADIEDAEGVPTQAQASKSALQARVYDYKDGRIPFYLLEICERHLISRYLSIQSNSATSTSRLSKSVSRQSTT